MTTLGNYICVIFIFLESFLINGIFTGWGMMASILKSDNLFNGEALESMLSERNIIFLRNILQWNGLLGSR